MDPSMFGMFTCIGKAYTSHRGHKPMWTWSPGCLSGSPYLTLSGLMHIWRSRWSEVLDV